MDKKIKKLLMLAFITTVSVMIFAGCDTESDTGQGVMMECLGELTETDARLFVDGLEVSTSTSLGGGIGEKPAFNVDEKTFLAARSMGIAFERDIMWQPNTQTLYFGQVPAPTNLVNVTTTSASTYMSLDDIYALGMTQIDAVNNNEPISFAGVSFVELFAEMDIDVTDASYFIFVGADSFYNVASAADVLNEENGLLALYEDEQRLDTHTRVVLVDDEAPGRWVRDVVEIIVVEGEIPNKWEREINIVADGTAVSQEEGDDSPAVLIMHRGKIYMPLYATADALGMPVEWNESENAILVGEGDVNFTHDEVDGGEIAINAGGTEFIVTMDDILDIGLEDFYAVVRDERVDYTGVSIVSIMEFLNLDATTATGEVTFTARDGHGTTGTVDEVFDPTNGFVAISQDGELLGHWEAGGRGPFMVVFAHDLFAQRFVRYLTEIDIDMPSPDGGRFNNHPITINGETFTANDLYALGATNLEWNDQNFIAVPLTDIVSGNFTGGRIIADDDAYRDLNAEDVQALYIAFYQEGQEPESENHFMSVITIDTNNQRRLNELATVELTSDDAGDADSVQIILGERTYNFSLADLAEFEPVSIDVVFRDEPRNFTGVPAIDIFNSLNIDTDGFTGGVVISGDDGFTQPFTIDELLDDTNFFLAFEEEGEEFAYIMSVFAHDDRPTRGVRELSIIRLLDGEEDVDSAIEGLGEGEFAIVHGNDSWTITMDDLEEIGFEDFTTNIPTGDASARHFTGVPLTSILAEFDINVDGATNMVTTSVDSTFNAAWNVDADLDYVFIAVAEDGEVLDPHYGPFMGVVQDRGANFNPRNLESITFN